MEFYKGTKEDLIQLCEKIRELFQEELSKEQNLDLESFEGVKESFSANLKTYVDDFKKEHNKLPNFMDAIEVEENEYVLVQENLDLAEQFPLRFNKLELLKLNLSKVMFDEIIYYSKENIKELKALIGPKTEEQKAEIRRLIFEGKLELMMDSHREDWKKKKLPSINYDCYPYFLLEEEPFRKLCEETLYFEKYVRTGTTPRFSQFLNSSYIYAYVYKEQPRKYPPGGLEAVSLKIAQHLITCLENPDYVPTLTCEEYEAIIGFTYNRVRVTGKCCDLVENYYKLIQENEDTFTNKPTKYVGELDEIARTFIKHFW